MDVSKKVWFYRFSLEDGKYKVIKSPIDLAECKNDVRSFLGRSEKGVYFAAIDPMDILRVWILRESSDHYGKPPDCRVPKCLPCAQTRAHGKSALCRVLAETAHGKRLAHGNVCIIWDTIYVINKKNIESVIFAVCIGLGTWQMDHILPCAMT